MTLTLGGYTNDSRHRSVTQTINRRSVTQIINRRSVTQIINRRSVTQMIYRDSIPSFMDGLRTSYESSLEMVDLDIVGENLL
jgi:hypothetical protein